MKRIILILLLVLTISTVNAANHRPEIILLSPQKNVYSDSVNFSFSATDNDGISYCELYTNLSGSWMKEKTTSENHLLINDVPTGCYMWNIKCYDTEENSGWAAPARVFCNKDYEQIIYEEFKGDYTNTSYSEGIIPSSETGTYTSPSHEFSELVKINSISYEEEFENWDYKNYFYKRTIKIESDKDLNNYQVLLRLNPEHFYQEDCSDIILLYNNKKLPAYSPQCGFLWTKIPYIDSSAKITAYYYSETEKNNILNKDVFTFPESQPLNYLISENNTELRIISFTDDNIVNNTVLNKGEILTIKNPEQGMIIESSAPVYSPELVPISYASKEFVYSVGRYNDEWNFYAPYKDSIISVYDGNNGAGFSRVGDEIRISHNNHKKIKRNIGTSSPNPYNPSTVLIKSTEPILATHTAENSADEFILHPPTTHWKGYSNIINIGVINSSLINTKNKEFNISSSDDYQFRGEKDYYSLKSNNIFGASYINDSGINSFSYIHASELSHEYFIPEDYDSLIIASNKLVTCKLYNDKSFIKEERKRIIKFESGDKGDYLICSSPVFAYYKTDKIRLLYGIPNHRKKELKEPLISMGEEVINPYFGKEYAQISVNDLRKTSDNPYFMNTYSDRIKYTLHLKKINNYNPRIKRVIINYSIINPPEILFKNNNTVLSSDKKNYRIVFETQRLTKCKYSLKMNEWNNMKKMGEEYSYNHELLITNLSQNNLYTYYFNCIDNRSRKKVYPELFIFYTLKPSKKVSIKSDSESSVSINDLITIETSIGEYDAQIISSSQESVDLSINSEIYTINQEEPVSVDLDNDGYDDVFITLSMINRTTTFFNFEEINCFNAGSLGFENSFYKYFINNLKNYDNDFTVRLSIFNDSGIVFSEKRDYLIKKASNNSYYSHIKLSPGIYTIKMMINTSNYDKEFNYLFAISEDMTIIEYSETPLTGSLFVNPVFWFPGIMIFLVITLFLVINNSEELKHYIGSFILFMLGEREDNAPAPEPSDNSKKVNNEELDEINKKINDLENKLKESGEEELESLRKKRTRLLLNKELLERHSKEMTSDIMKNMNNIDKDMRILDNKINNYDKKSYNPEVIKNRLKKLYKIKEVLEKK